ncbi:hypothetical protein [Parasphingorhabdus sp.]|uniref:hypothetical protein n=1 Tax=Parasphingorhabdus sp. TaxID=2709688 RepID=UPI002B26DF56|nr:hypothetical protein [Parasphingorhabdus sp.]
MTRFHYRAYEMQIISNQLLDSLMPVAGGRPADLTLQFSEMAELPEKTGGHSILRTTGMNAAGLPYLEVFMADEDGNGPWLAKHRSDKGAIDYILHASPKRIEVIVQSGTPAEDIEAYLTGAVFGYFLRLCGSSCLHGGFLSWQGKAIGVVGPKGAGKSTLTAGWAQQGLPVLADDVGCLIANGESWKIASAYPRIRLWPATFNGLALENAQKIGNVMSFADKVYVDLENSPFCFEAEAQPLGAILVLAPRTAGELTIEKLIGASALAALLGQIYAPQAGGKQARIRDVKMLTDVIKTVAVYRAALPNRYDWLRHNSMELLDQIIDEFSGNA